MLVAGHADPVTRTANCNAIVKITLLHRQCKRMGIIRIINAVLGKRTPGP